jgi:ATP-binding cassette subfamily G (WHITE) protein 2
LKQVSLQLSGRSGGSVNTFAGHIELRKQGGALRAVGILLRYRTRSNYRSSKFIAQRAAGPFLFSLVLTTMYWQQGSKLQDMTNQLNIGSLLFMANILPAYVAAGQMPSIVLERPRARRRLLPRHFLHRLQAHRRGPRRDSRQPHHPGHDVLRRRSPRLVHQVLAHQLLHRAERHRPRVCVLQRRQNHGRRQHAAACVQHVPAAVQRWEPNKSKWWTHTLFVRYGWQAQLMNHFGRNQEPKVFLDKVGRCKLKIQLTHSLKAPGFNP